MAFNISAGIGLDGEKEFKKAVTGINKDLTVLGSEMKKVTAQFDGNANSMAALTAKQDVYNKRADEQRKKIEVITAALENAKKEYGENSDQVKNWQIKLNNAEADLAKTEKALNETTEELDNFGKEADDGGDAIEKAGDSAEKSGGKFGKLGGVLKAAGVAMGAIAVAAGAAALKLGKEVVAAFAEYEQLIGGVETLFKDSAPQILEYANNAFKTAGLSANQYMETVTSFSASLISSLGGDTEKAAKYADMAITDMSDNANKMGSDISSIQNAYQGFAKQQYTMLDNLKLGYGGTKSEMERLLADAEAISGIHYDVSSYADVVDAIHVIQVEMGVAGTTAKEAEATITGSLGMLKSSFGNFITGLGVVGADMEGLTKNMADSFKAVVTNIVPVIQNLTNALPVAFGAILDALGELLPMLLETAVGLFKQILDTLLGLLPTLIPVAVDAVMTIVDALIDNLPLIISGALQLILALATGLADSLPELIPAMVDAVLLIVETLIDNVDMMIDAALAIILALTQGLINAIPRILERLPEIIAAIVKALVDNIPLIISTGVTLLVALVQNLPAIIAGIVKAIPKIITAIVNGVKEGISQLAAVGGELIVGLWQGISDKAEWLWNKVKGFFSTLTNKIKDFFGIASPSKVFAGMGDFMAQGLGVGFERGMKGVAAKMTAAVPTDFAINGSFAGSGVSTGGIVNQFNISQLVVREDADIDRIAYALFRRQRIAARGVGIV